MNKEKEEDYGLSSSNPIQVSNIGEGYLYLDRIVTELGEKIRFERTGSQIDLNIKRIVGGREVYANIDEYEVYDQEGNFIVHFYICPYFDKNSTVAPKGFKYLSASSIREEPDSMESFFQNPNMLRGMKLPDGREVDVDRIMELTRKKLEDQGIEIPPGQNIEEFMKDFYAKKKDAAKVSNTGCFIATATMGSYDNPVVMELRKFRDKWILKKRWGRKFVSYYYIYGFKASKYIENSFFLKWLSYYFLVMPLYFFAKSFLKNLD